jgi:uncharacterized protein
MILCPTPRNWIVLRMPKSENRTIMKKPLSKYNCDKVYVGQSTICPGRGVFAKKSIKKNEIIEVAPIITIDKDDSNIVCVIMDLSRYVFAMADNATMCLGLGYTSLYNHQRDNPNATYAVGKDSIVLVAKSDIKKGEEIFFCYNDAEKLEFEK